MKTFPWFWFVVSAVSAAAKVIVTKPGQRLTLECRSTSTFKNLVWYHEGELIVGVNGKTGARRKGTVAIQTRSKVKQGSNLEITGVKKEDAGKFSCSLDDYSEVHTLLVVSVSTSPPDRLQLGGTATLQCEVTGLTSDSIVQWTRPDGRTDSGTVHLSPVTLSDAGTWVCVFSHDGETFRESLDVKMKESEPLTSPTPSSKDDPETPCTNCSCSPSGCADHPPSVGLPDWWLWVAVGVGSFFVLLLMVCIIVLCRRNRRRKRKFQRMKNEHQSERTRKYCQCNCPTAAAKPQQGRHKGKPSALPLKPLLTH